MDKNPEVKEKAPLQGKDLSLTGQTEWMETTHAVKILNWVETLVPVM